MGLFRNKAVLACLTALCLACGGCASQPEDISPLDADGLIVLTIGTADTGGTMTPVGTAIAQVLSTDQLKFNISTSTGSFMNIQNLSSGEIDLGLVAGDSAYTAVYGTEDSAPTNEDLRAVAAVFSSTSNWMSPIRTGAFYVHDLKGMRIGVPQSYLGEGLDLEVREAVLDAARVLKEKGAVVEYFDLKLTDYAIPAYYVIASAEASSNLSRFDGVKYGYRTPDYEGLHSMYKKSRSEGFGPEVKRRIMLGSFVLSSGYYDAYYLKALRTKALIKQEFDRAFGRYDVILAPASPDTAPRLGESLRDPLKMYLGDIYTISVNLAGLPGISVPCGRDSRGLPIGLQLIGDCFKEKDIIRAAYAYERTRNREMPDMSYPDLHSGKEEARS